MHGLTLWCCRLAFRSKFHGNSHHVTLNYVGREPSIARNRLEIGPVLKHHSAMKTVLQLEALTRQEKLRAMEELWEDLTRADEQYESPNWHGDVLRAREEALKAGKDEFVPWDEAKRMLREAKK